jgi:pSer/pThr/pTyr-binding forkhead associated (FHA) protein
MARLVLDCDGVSVITHELIGDVLMIGREPSSDVVIDNPTVSAQHAALTKLPSGYRLTDLGSTNGTQVNGISITDAELKDGAEIRFGYVMGVFRRPTTGIDQSTELQVPEQSERPARIQVLETQRIFSSPAQ